MDEEEVGRFQIGVYTFVTYKRADGTYRSEPLPPPSQEVGIPIIPKEQRILAKFESHSKPGDFHLVIQAPSGDVFCTCFGFRAPDHCWHFRSIMEVGPDNIKDTLVITLNDFETFKKLGGSNW